MCSGRACYRAEQSFAPVLPICVSPGTRAQSPMHLIGTEESMGFRLHSATNGRGPLPVNAWLEMIDRWKDAVC